MKIELLLYFRELIIRNILMTGLQKNKDFLIIGFSYSDKHP